MSPINSHEIELVIDREDAKRYYIKGTNILHRDDGPAFEDVNGDKYWYQYGKFHRIDGPAVEFLCDYKEWYQYGRLHRLDGPAIEHTNGHKEWHVEGKLHRLDGPAVEWTDGNKQFWINGKHIENVNSIEEALIKSLLE